MQWRRWERRELSRLKVIYRITSITRWNGWIILVSTIFDANDVNDLGGRGGGIKEHDVRSQVSHRHMSTGYGQQKPHSYSIATIYSWTQAIFHRLHCSLQQFNGKKAFSHLTEQTCFDIQDYVKQWQAFKAHTELYFIGHKYQTTLVSYHLQFLFAYTNVPFSLLRKRVLYCGILQYTDFVSFFLSCRKAFRHVLKEVKLLHLWIHYSRLTRQFRYKVH
jgi:hypothetical protein